MKTEYVICPICNKKVREINTAHLKKHNLDVCKFDELFQNYERLSDYIRKRKNTWSGKKHTIADIEKMKANMKGKKHRPHTEEEKKKISENSKKIWLEKREQILFSRSIDGYILRFGKEEGCKKYLSIKTGPKSIINNIDEYKKYCRNVDKITKLSIKRYKLENLDKRSRMYHVDHKVSKHYGFVNNIEPRIIGSIYNLEIIECSLNCSKQHYYNSIDIKKLIEKVENDNFYENFKEIK